MPPSLGSISFRPMNQASIPSPVATACHACSGVAPTLTSCSSSNALPISFLLHQDSVLKTGARIRTHRGLLDEFRQVDPSLWRSPLPKEIRHLGAEHDRLRPRRTHR